MSGDRYEATATGVLVKMMKSGQFLGDHEIQFYNEDTTEPLTVAQEKERILKTLGLPVQNSQWKIQLSNIPPINMEEAALVKTYVDSLNQCTEVEVFYI